MSDNKEVYAFIKAYWEAQKQKQAPKPKEENKKEFEELFYFVRKTGVDTSEDGGENDVSCSPKRTNVKHSSKSSSSKRLLPTIHPCHQSSGKTRARKSSEHCKSQDSFNYSSDSSSENPFFHSTPKFDSQPILPKKSSFQKNAEHSRHRRSYKSKTLERSSSYEIGDAHQSSGIASRARRSSKYCRRHDSSCSSECEYHRHSPNRKVRRSRHQLQHTRRSLSGSPYRHQRKFAKIDGHQKDHKRHRSPSFERQGRSPARRKDRQHFIKDLANRRLSRFSCSTDNKIDDFQGKARDKDNSKWRKEEFIKAVNLKKDIKKWILSNDDGPASNMPGPSHRSPTVTHIKREPNNDGAEKSLLRHATSRYLDRSKGDYFCKLCDSHMNNINMWEQHIRGQRHIKNFQKAPGESMCQTKSIKLPFANSKLEDKINREASDEIIVGLDFIRETRVLAGEIYNCFLCGACSTNYDILRHLMSTKHRTNYLEQLHIFCESNIKRVCTELMKKYGRGKVEVYQSKN